MFDDAVDVGVLRLEQLMEPMGRLNVWVAAHLAKDGGTFDAFVGDGVEFAEEGGASDFSHGSKWMVEQWNIEVKERSPDQSRDRWRVPRSATQSVHGGCVVGRIVEGEKASVEWRVGRTKPITRTRTRRI